MRIINRYFERSPRARVAMRVVLVLCLLLVAWLAVLVLSAGLSVA
jgi:hypothetical protein